MDQNVARSFTSTLSTSTNASELTPLPCKAMRSLSQSRKPSISVLDEHLRPSITPATDPPIFNKFSEVTQKENDKGGANKILLTGPHPYFLLKECLNVLLPLVTRLVNLSLMKCSFPDSFKQAVVTPLVKKSTLPSEDLKDYCRVSGLCFTLKLVERVVAKQIKDHIGNNHLDNHNQSAYKAVHSAELGLLFIKNEVHLDSQRACLQLSCCWTCRHHQ